MIHCLSTTQAETALMAFITRCLITIPDLTTLNATVIFAIDCQESKHTRDLCAKLGRNPGALPIVVVHSSVNPTTNPHLRALLAQRHVVSISLEDPSLYPGGLAAAIQRAQAKSCPNENADALWEELYKDYASEEAKAICDSMLERMESRECSAGPDNRDLFVRAVAIGINAANDAALFAACMQVCAQRRARDPDQAVP